MAKKQEILIIDNELYYSLFEMYNPKDYDKEKTLVRKITTEMAIREKIGSFVLELGFFSKTNNRFEFEGRSQIVYLKASGDGRKAVEFLKKNEQKGNPVDPEDKLRRNHIPRTQAPALIQYDQNQDEVPF